MSVGECINNACCNQLGHKQDIKNLIVELEDTIWYAYKGATSRDIIRKLTEIKEKYGTICS